MFEERLLNVFNAVWRGIISLYLHRVLPSRHVSTSPLRDIICVPSRIFSQIGVADVSLLGLGLRLRSRFGVGRKNCL